MKRSLLSILIPAFLWISAYPEDRPRVDSIEFFGNEHYSSAKLHLLMGTKKDRFYKRSRFYNDVLIRDLKDIIDFYYVHGFQQASLEDLRIEWNDNSSRVDLKIYLSEGRPMIVDSVSVTGARKLPLEEVRKLQAAGTTSVLITGESGTGKELIARAIHYGGPRAENAFIARNCTTIPYELAESELFGHVRGAFTGADADRKGCFELADGGTLFLDEIGEMPVGLQPKLLRVLEEGCFLPVGGTHEICVDVRIVAATNRNLEAKMAEGTFRDDLYYRLARFIVNVPPLRERPEDIPLLAAHFLRLFAAEMGLKGPSLGREALAELASHRFPGNVRELKNMIERALIQSGGGEIGPEHLYPRGGTSVSEISSDAEAAGMEPGSRVPLNLKEADAMLIQQALEQADGNMSEAARLLGIGRKTLYRKLTSEKEAADGRRQTADETDRA